MAVEVFESVVIVAGFNDIVPRSRDVVEWTDVRIDWTDVIIVRPVVPDACPDGIVIDFHRKQRRANSGGIVCHGFDLSPVVVLGHRVFGKPAPKGVPRHLDAFIGVFFLDFCKQFRGAFVLPRFLAGAIQNILAHVRRVLDAVRARKRKHDFVSVFIHGSLEPVVRDDAAAGVNARIAVGKKFLQFFLGFRVGYSGIIHLHGRIRTLLVPVDVFHGAAQLQIFFGGRDPWKSQDIERYARNVGIGQSAKIVFPHIGPHLDCPVASVQ